MSDIQTKQPNAFRAIFDEVLPFYGGDVEQIPDITGEHFISLGTARNDCNYLPEKKYLHFFPTQQEAVEYGQDLLDETGKEVSIVGFYFDEEMLKECTFTGTYMLADYSRAIKKPEYIIPLELYNSEKNYIGVVAKPEKPVYDPDGYMSGFFF